MLLFWHSLVTGMLVAVMCAYIGVYVVVKRIVFVGVSLAQISAAGIALAFLLGRQWPYLTDHPLLVSLIVTLAGVLIYAQPGIGRRLPSESLIGLGYLMGSALTVIFIARTPQGLQEINEILYGSIVAADIHDVEAMAGVFAAVMLVHALFYKQFLFTSFDPDTAATQGYQVRRWETLFYFALGLTVAVATQTAGLLTVFAYLVIPPMTGLLVARRMSGAFAVAMVCALLSTLVGFYWSFRSEVLPTSPPTIVVAVVLLALAWVVRRLRREG
jgi:ABC-type Mn2+/Zn2+ transport system permease subunit